jgi:RHS repeat-associated protein
MVLAAAQARCRELLAEAVTFYVLYGAKSDENAAGGEGLSNSGEGTRERCYHSTDHEGSTDVITDASGNIVWDGEYEAFGSVVRSNGSIRFDASYTGKEFDTDTGLYYFNARWYDPTLGRFITEDPARAGDNWFAYCNNDPLGLIDPSGLDPITSDHWKKDPTGGLGVGAPGQRPGWHYAHIEGNPIQVPNGYKIPDVGGAVATGDELLFVGGAEAVGKGAFKGAEKLIAKKAAAAGEKEAVKAAADEGAKTVGEAASKATDAASDHYLHRPYIRDSTRQAAEDAAPKAADGSFIDPNTGKVIDGSYDLGHKPGNEFWREQAKAEGEGLTQKQFNDRMNNPDYYQIEDPSSNRGRQYEMPK